MTVGDVLPAPEVRDAPTPPRAPWSTRVIALVLDTLLLGTYAWFVAPGVLGPELWPGLPQLTSPALDVERGLEVETWTSSTVVAAAVLVLLLLQAWTGASVGKRAVGVVVVDAVTGRPVGVVRTLWRQVLHLLDAILLIGYLRPLWHAERRTFADSIARTDVVESVWPPPWRRVPAVVDRWARPLAVALCVVGVVGAFPVAGGSASRAVDQTCEVDTAPAGTTAQLEVDVYRSWETRWWVRREVPVEPAPWRVSWFPGSDGVGDGDDVRVFTTVTALDGPQDGRAWRGSTPNSFGPQGERLGEVTRLDAPATGTFGVDSALVVRGTTVATCTAVVRIADADVAVPGP